MKTALCAAALLLGTAAAHADVQALLKEGRCLQCHHPAQERIGPSWKTISARYKGADAKSVLVNRMKEGSAGVYGTVPMGPNLHALQGWSDEDLQQIATYILSF